VSGWKLCQIHQRPEPRSAEVIGTWQSIFELIALSAVFVNAGLVAFTSDLTDQFASVYRVWIFISIVILLLGIKELIAFLVPDVPVECIIQQARNNFIASKVIDNIADIDGIDVNELDRAKADFTVKALDDDPL
jgi:hypothetical protein